MNRGRRVEEEKSADVKASERLLHYFKEREIRSSKNLDKQNLWSNNETKTAMAKEKKRKKSNAP